MLKMSKNVRATLGGGGNREGGRRLVLPGANADEVAKRPGLPRGWVTVEAGGGGQWNERCATLWWLR